MTVAGYIEPLGEILEKYDISNHDLLMELATYVDDEVFQALCDGGCMS